MLNKEQKFNLQHNMEYVTLVDKIDSNYDRLGCGTPIKLFRKAVSNISNALLEAKTKFGVDVYNDLVNEFELKKFNIFPEEDDI